MIDHLLIAADQQTLVTAIGSIVPLGPNPQPLWQAATSDSPAGWRGDIAFPVDIADNGVPLTDYHLWVALPTIDPVLAALSNCVLIADSDAYDAGNPNWIIQTSYTPAQRSGYRISPIRAGSNYPFGAV
jgi:hypothetical protein